MIEPVLVDSDILIEVFRGRSTEILRRWKDLAESGSMVGYSQSAARSCGTARRFQRSS